VGVTRAVRPWKRLCPGPLPPSQPSPHKRGIGWQPIDVSVVTKTYPRKERAGVRVRGYRNLSNEPGHRECTAWPPAGCPSSARSGATLAPRIDAMKRSPRRGTVSMSCGRCASSSRVRRRARRQSVRMAARTARPGHIPSNRSAVTTRRPGHASRDRSTARLVGRRRSA